MNKKQLIAKLSGSLNLSKADAERTFDTITNTILDALKGDDSVKIAGIGTYKVAKRKARVGRNPRTGADILFINLVIRPPLLKEWLYFLIKLITNAD